jgi:hypothetical protein
MDADIVKTVGAWGAGIVALATSAAVLARRLSKDRTEITKDAAEASFVSQLLKERDAAIASAREAWKERYQDSNTIARLKAENEYQARELARLSDDFAAFKRLLGRMYPETRPFVESGFIDESQMDIDELPLPERRRNDRSRS